MKKLFVLVLCFFLASPVFASKVLFGPPQGMEPSAPLGGTIDSVTVQANFSALAASSIGEEFEALVAPGTYLTLKVTRIKHRKNGVAVSGTVITAGGGHFLFFVEGDAASGSIFTKDADYQVLYAGSPHMYIIKRLDHSKMIAPDHGGKVPPVSFEAPAAGDMPLPSNAPANPAKTVIDILFVYSPGVASTYPGTHLSTFLNSLIAKANEAYVNSGVNLELRLVGSVQKNFSDSSSADATLDALTQAQGVFSNVPALRDQYGADIVVAVSKLTNSNQWCGLGWLLTAFNPLFKNYGYAIVETGSNNLGYCSSYTFAHEVGHVLGCQHDHAHASTQGLYNYSYGYDQSGTFATIMSYEYPEIPYFSNPSLSYEGHAIGVENYANNAATLNASRDFVANYEPTVIPYNDDGGNDNGGSDNGGNNDDGGSVSYCTLSAQSQKYEYIRGVHIGNMSNTSGKSPYTDFTAKTINATQGAAVSVNLTPGFAGKAYTESWTIYVDYNHDGDFSDANEKVFQKASKTTVGGSFTVPASAATGVTRLRVVMKYQSPPYNVCGSFNYGEVEDYTISIGEGNGGGDNGGGNNGGDDGGNDGGSDDGGSASYCSASGSSQSYEYIKSVRVGSFTKPSGASHYSDFTGSVIHLVPGTTVPVVLTPGFPHGKPYTEAWRIWIDYNHDGDFNDAGELVYQGASNHAISSHFAVKSSASGATRMRVVMSYKSYAGPCGAVKYGEIEDYTVSFGGSNGGGGNGGGDNGGGNNGGGSSDPTYSSSSAMSQKYEYIRQVQFGSMVKSSSASHYSDFTGTTATVTKGSSVVLKLTPGFKGKAYNEFWRVWIDYNHDGDFNDPGELVYQGHGASTLTHSVSIKNVSVTTRMRVSMQYKAYPASSGTFKYGEVEDYTVHIQ